MLYIWQHFESQDIDEPTDVYVQLDEGRRELRRLELYPGGQAFACGGERGNQEALGQEPWPEDLRELDGSARSIPPGAFQEVWMAALERPDGFQGMFA